MALQRHTRNQAEICGTDIAAQLHRGGFAGMVVVSSASCFIRVNDPLPVGVFRVIDKGGLGELHFDLTLAWQAWKRGRPPDSRTWGLLLIVSGLCLVVVPAWQAWKSVLRLATDQNN